MKGGHVPYLLILRLAQGDVGGAVFAWWARRRDRIKSIKLCMELNLKILKKEKEKASLVCQGACGGGFHVLRRLDQEIPIYLVE